MLYAIMEFVHAFLNIKEIPIAYADQNVSLIMNALKIKHAYEINVWTLVQELVVKMHCVKFIITYQCVDVLKE